MQNRLAQSWELVEQGTASRLTLDSTSGNKPESFEFGIAWGNAPFMEAHDVVDSGKVSDVTLDSTSGSKPESFEFGIAWGNAPYLGPFEQ